MYNFRVSKVWTLVAAIALGGCGLYVPQKDLIPRPPVDGQQKYARGEYENELVGHLICQVKKGLYRVAKDQLLGLGPNKVEWMYTKLFLPTKSVPTKPATSAKPAGGAVKKTGEPQRDAWGTSITLTIQVDEQGGLSPGIATNEPFRNAIGIFPTAQGGNVVTPQNFSFGVGASASAHTTRSETIQFTLVNYELLDDAKFRWDKKFSENPEKIDCSEVSNGILIDSDLAIDQFIFDKAYIAKIGNIGNISLDGNPFNTFQEQLTFTSSLGVSTDPAWKLVHITADQNSTLAGVARGETNTVTISMGPIDFSTPVTRTTALELKGSAQAQKNAAGVGVATSGSVTASH